VRTPSASPENYARALWRAERACSLTAEDSRLLLARGAAKLRLFEISAAILDLERSATGAAGVPDRLPFLAMAYYRAGRLADAREQVEKLSEIMRTYGGVTKAEPNFRSRFWDDDPDLQALMAEAVQLVRGDGR